MKVRCLLSFALLLFACTNEQAPPAQAPGPGVVAIVLGRSIERIELAAQSLESLVIPPLLERFRKENGITATDSEIRGFMQVVMSTDDAQDAEDWSDPESRETEEFRRSMAEDYVLGWKVDRRMYELYGGDVIFQQANPMEPVGAYRKFLEDEEMAGRFKILDPALAESFWAYYRRKYSVVMEPSEVDYSVPWWTQKR